MTDSRFFHTTAINRSTGEWKKFWAFFPNHHHAAALAWLATK